MEAISFGPLIRGAHSPDEYVDASTVAASWSLLTALLAEFAENGDN
jgi:dipeptidase D